MKRIDTASRALDLFGPGKDGFKDGDLANGIAPTAFNASWVNTVQEELAFIVETNGGALDPNDRTQVWRAIRSQLAMGSRVKGLTGNTVGAGFTTVTFSAAEVLMRNPTTGASLLALNVGPVVCNIGTAGPAANGRDQAGAFSNNSWVHFWFISNGAAVATLASASATAPTLPAGFVAAAYIGAVRLGTGTLAGVSFFGNRFIYAGYQVALAGGTAAAATPVNVAAFVPPNALTFDLQVQTLAVSSNGSGGYSATAYLNTNGTDRQYVYGIGGVAGVSQIMSVAGQVFEMPNLGQAFNYRIDLVAGSGTSTGLLVTSYKNPNGGE